MLPSNLQDLLCTLDRDFYSLDPHSFDLLHLLVLLSYVSVINTSKLHLSYTSSSEKDVRYPRLKTYEICGVSFGGSLSRGQKVYIKLEEADFTI